ncbi:hypothetical protein HYPSUDRAFT_207569 [Hypholoma sublateritium FD-334 SS-4]|uniref:Uncharacterized protein n=1 Tax=Hypholoma sublateritium (strain FD-334 SS-4) TaxID=945553 RepID=A0A0D2LY32_HYPSF|nr:hypothetical protein HYPSUDRAFT_207569 [Hypholoma sublateritium FD-334 SS-4]
MAAPPSVRRLLPPRAIIRAVPRSRPPSLHSRFSRIPPSAKYTRPRRCRSDASSRPAISASKNDAACASTPCAACGSLGCICPSHHDRPASTQRPSFDLLGPYPPTPQKYTPRGIAAPAPNPVADRLF